MTQERASSTKSFEPPARAGAEPVRNVDGRRQPRWRSKKSGAGAADSASSVTEGGSAAAKRVRADEHEGHGMQRQDATGIDQSKVVKIAILGASVSGVALRERLRELVDPSAKS